LPGAGSRKRWRGVEAVSRERWERLDQIFHEAIALPAAERASFLDRACSNDSDLRAEVQGLIGAHEGMPGFIDAPAIAGADTWLKREVSPPVAGWRLGAYRIEREVGRGGMGAV